MVLLSVFFGSLFVYAVFVKSPKNVEKWEKRFISMYDEKPSDFLKIHFDGRIEDPLYQLCRKIASKRNLQKSPPQLQTHFIDFKKVNHIPFRVEMIRCNDNYAIIPIRETLTGFILKKPTSWLGKKDEDEEDDETFYIRKKFRMRCTSPSKTSEGSQRGPAGFLRSFWRSRSEKSTLDADKRNANQFKDNAELNAGRENRCLSDKVERTPVLSPNHQLDRQHNQTFSRESSSEMSDTWENSDEDERTPRDKKFGTTSFSEHRHVGHNSFDAEQIPHFESDDSRPNFEDTHQKMDLKIMHHEQVVY